jgi:hypothetical protein
MNNNIKEGLCITSRFAIEPNMYGFCGEKKDQEFLRGGLKGVNLPKVRQILNSEGFPHLNSFLSAIAKITDLNPFSSEVVKSYWFGNTLTDDTYEKGRYFLISEYAKRISSFDHVLEKKLPKNIYLTHLSQVVLIAAEHYEGKEKEFIINQCMIAQAKVLSVNPVKMTAIVNRDTLEKNENQGYEVIIKKQEVKLDPDLTPPLNVGDSVAIHLGYLATKLNPNEEEKLKYWTRKVAKII